MEELTIFKIPAIMSEKQQQLQFWSNAFPVDFALYTCEIHTIL